MKVVSGTPDEKRRRGRESLPPGPDRTETPSTAPHAQDSRAFAVRVGEVIRRERQLRKWTQAVVAEQAGLSPNYVARLERGELGPSLFVARRICEALGISLDVLAGHSPARAPRVRRDSTVLTRREAPTTQRPPSADEEE